MPDEARPEPTTVIWIRDEIKLMVGPRRIL